MKGLPADAKHEADNDRFWVSEFDDVHQDFNDGDVDNVMISLDSAIKAVGEAIIDHYGDAMNHPPGFKPLKLKSIDDVSEKDLMSIIGVVDPKMIERDAEEKKKAAEESAAASAAQKKHAAERIEDIAKALKKHEAAGWKEFLRVVKSEVKKKAKHVTDYFPKGTSYEKIEAVSSIEDLKALFTKPTDLVSSIADSVFNLPGMLPKEESYLVGLAYVVSKNAALSKKLIALLK